MYEFYEKTFDRSALRRNRKLLNRLYDEIPETSGCLDNIAKENGCGGWCCKYQSPQVMYSEFLNTWHNVMRNWAPERTTKLVMSAVIGYLDSDQNPGCIFFDAENKTCQTHQHRPYNCRVYAQTPDEEFQPRLARLKVLYPEKEYRDQCNLVETVGKKPTKDEMDLWFHHLNLIEKELLGKNAPIHDKEGGTYRTYRDHLLLKVGSAKFLLQLTKMKLKGTTEQKEQFLIDLEKRLLKSLTMEKETTH